MNILKWAVIVITVKHAIQNIMKHGEHKEKQQLKFNSETPGTISLKAYIHIYELSCQSHILCQENCMFKDTISQEMYQEATYCKQRLTH